MLSIDEITKKIKEFQNTHLEDHYHLHNTYYMYTEDIDGNITGEAYGINFMTNYGFNRLCSSEQYSDITVGSNINFNRINGRPIFGTGTGPLNFNEPASEIPKIQEFFAMPSYETALSVISTEYDSTTGVIYETDYVGCGALDYNISGVTTDTNITEVGIGYDATHLYFHFLTRNKDGEISPIVKRPNEKLTIYVYHTFCVHENVMLDALARNEYVLTNPSAFFNAMALYDRTPANYYSGYDICALMNNRSYSYRSDADQFIRDDYDNSLTSPNRKIRDCISNNSIYTNNECEYTITMTNSILLENKNAYIGLTIYSGYRDKLPDYNNSAAFCRSANGVVDMFIFMFDKQTDDEEIVCENMYTNDSSTNKIDVQYGNRYDSSRKTGAVSVVDYNITSCKMFNVIDNDFTINESVEQNSNFQNFQFFHARCRYYNFICKDGISRTIYVSVNPWVTMKLKKFTNTGIIIFAASKAWDPSTWVQIPNINDIPEELSQARYYVSYSNECLSFTFQDQYYPRIVPKTNIIQYDDKYDHDLNSGFTQAYDWENRCGYIVGCDNYNWFAIGKTIFLMNDDNTINSRYNMRSLNRMHWHNRFAYKQLFLSTERDNMKTSIVRLCHVNNDNTVSEYILPTAFSKECACSWSDTGSCKNGRFIVCETDETSGAIVYDMEILSNTSGSQIYEEYSSTDQQQILDDFVQGTINDSTGENVPITPDTESVMWMSTKSFIELPETFDSETKKINISVTGLGNSTMSFRDLWVKFYFYDENDAYLGCKYVKSSPAVYTNQTTNDGILTGIRKVKLSLHCGYDTDQYWMDAYCISPTKLESLTMAAYVTTPAINGIIHIPDAYHTICMKDVNKLIYTKKDSEYIKSWYIQDLEHLDVLPEKILLEDGQYGNSFADGMGFSHYLYIRITDPSNVYSTWMYDMNTHQWTHLVDWNYSMSKAVVCGNEKCIIFSGSFSYYKYIITSDEPTTCRILSDAKWDSTTLKYINNGKQLVVSSNVVTRYRDYPTYNVNYQQCYPRTYDLGVWLRDKSWVYGEPRLRFGDSINSEYDYSYKAFNYPYKNGVITLAPQTTSNDGWTLYYYPIEYYIPHKTVGTTKTITAYNNPIKITGKGYKFTRTNDMTKLGLDNN